jgi:hypothetical protein
MAGEKSKKARGAICGEQGAKATIGAVFVRMTLYFAAQSALAIVRNFC